MRQRVIFGLILGVLTASGCSSSNPSTDPVMQEKVKEKRTARIEVGKKKADPKGKMGIDRRAIR